MREFFAQFIERDAPVRSAAFMPLQHAMNKESPGRGESFKKSEIFFDVKKR
jgi:hypothetical protein